MGHREYIHKAEGRSVIDTKHAFERAVQRGAVSKIHAGRFLDEMVKGCLADKRFMAAPNDTEWFVVHRGLQQGVIVTFKRDFRSSKKKRAFVLVSVYPYGKLIPAQKDTGIIYV